MLYRTGLSSVVLQTALLLSKAFTRKSVVKCGKGWYWQHSGDKPGDVIFFLDETKTASLPHCSVLYHNPDELDCGEWLFSLQFISNTALEGLFPEGHQRLWAKRCPMILFQPGSVPAIPKPPCCRLLALCYGVNSSEIVEGAEQATRQPQLTVQRGKKALTPANKDEIIVDVNANVSNKGT